MTLAGVAVDGDGDALGVGRVDERPDWPPAGVVGVVAQDELEVAAAAGASGYVAIGCTAFRSTATSARRRGCAPVGHRARRGAETATRPLRGGEVGAVLQSEAEIVDGEAAGGLWLPVRPVWASASIRSYSAASSVIAMPASPPLTGLLPCRLKQPMSPQVPTDRPPYRGTMGVRAVLDERDAVAASDLDEPIHAGRVAPHVDHADRLRPWRDPRLHVVGVGGERALVDVAEHRDTAEVEHWRGGGEERVRRHDDLVAGFTPTAKNVLCSAAVPLFISSA